MGYWILKMNRVRWRIKADAARKQYSDLSLSKQEEGEFDALSLFTETRGGQGAVAKKRQEAAARAAVRAGAVQPARANVAALPGSGAPS